MPDSGQKQLGFFNSRLTFTPAVSNVQTPLSATLTVQNVVRLVIVLPPVLTMPSWSSKASVKILSRNILKRVGESRHSCQTPTVVWDQFPMLHTPPLTLRSSADTRIFRIPNRRKGFQGQCTFSFTGPSIWNNLPFSLQHAQTLSAFKSQLKTHRFFYLVLLLV